MGIARIGEVELLLASVDELHGCPATVRIDAGNGPAMAIDPPSLAVVAGELHAVAGPQLHRLRLEHLGFASAPLPGMPVNRTSIAAFKSYTPSLGIDSGNCETLTTPLALGGIVAVEPDNLADGIAGRLARFGAGQRDIQKPVFIFVGIVEQAQPAIAMAEAYLGDQMRQVDPDAIHAAREALQRSIGAELEPLWRDVHAGLKANGFALSPAAKGARKLRNAALHYLVASGAADGPGIAFDQFSSADNMTERQAALGTLANGVSPERVAALDIFYNRYSADALTLDKWFQTQAFAFHPDTVELVEELGRHKDFTLSNPNRVRALYGAVSGNQWAFHHRSGKGYRLVADCIIALDGLNPQTAARLVPPLGRWKRFDTERAALMQAELLRILAQPGLSKDVTEQARKSLD